MVELYRDFLQIRSYDEFPTVLKMKKRPAQIVMFLHFIFRTLKVKCYKLFMKAQPKIVNKTIMALSVSSPLGFHLLYNHTGFALEI